MFATRALRLSLFVSIVLGCGVPAASESPEPTPAPAVPSAAPPAPPAPAPTAPVAADPALPALAPDEAADIIGEPLGPQLPSGASAEELLREAEGPGVATEPSSLRERAGS